MVWKTQAGGTFSCGRRWTFKKKTQNSVFYGNRYDDGHLILLDTRYWHTHTRSCTHTHIENVRLTCCRTLPAVVLVLVMLSNFIFWTNIEQRHLFPLYVIQVSSRRTRCVNMRKTQLLLLYKLWFLFVPGCHRVAPRLPEQHGVRLETA